MWGIGSKQGKREGYPEISIKMRWEMGRERERGRRRRRRKSKQRWRRIREEYEKEGGGRKGKGRIEEGREGRPEERGGEGKR